MSNLRPLLKKVDIIDIKTNYSSKLDEYEALRSSADGALVCRGYLFFRDLRICFHF